MKAEGMIAKNRYFSIIYQNTIFSLAQ